MTLNLVQSGIDGLCRHWNTSQIGGGGTVRSNSFGFFLPGAAPIKKAPMANWELTIGRNVRFLLTLRRQNEDGTAEVIRIGHPLDGKPARRTFQPIWPCKKEVSNANPCISSSVCDARGPDPSADSDCQPDGFLWAAPKRCVRIGCFENSGSAI